MSHANRHRCLRVGAREYPGVLAADQVGAGATEPICRVRVTDGGVEFEDLEPVPWAS